MNLYTFSIKWSLLYVFLIAVLVMITGCGKKIINHTDSKGNKQGKWLEQYEDGQIMSIRQYKDGFKYGEEKEFYNNGQLMNLKNWESDEYAETLHGWSIMYSYQGELIFKMHYDHGIPHDSVLEYYNSGTLKMKGFYNQGIKASVWEFYDQAEQLTKSIEYEGYDTEWVDESLNGKYIYYIDHSPIYEVVWYKDQLASDTVYHREAYEILLEDGTIVQAPKFGEIQ